MFLKALWLGRLGFVLFGGNGKVFGDLVHLQMVRLLWLNL